MFLLYTVGGEAAACSSHASLSSSKFSCFKLIYLCFMSAPVSIHPATIIEMMVMKKVNAMKGKGTEATYLSICFFCSVFIHVHTCPRSVPSEREQRAEGGG